ncbi:clarin-3 [Ischnura elegans]|uniref:clarin-3 n=1 Tax=Ischnura elegans TaxID=197161 RepID=UPI001ED87039|nr:clarin-3 [Ischnura elegans]
MNLYRRGMIFATFLGSCLTLALSGAAMGTMHWVEGHARRTSNPSDSDGRIHFGLFYGYKNLNVAYGWRRYDIDVMEILKAEPEFLIWGLWVATIACLCLAEIFAIVSAAFAVINTAITPVSTIAGIIGLYVWNTLTVMFNLAAVITWAVQFHKKLKDNVMTQEDLEIHWSSKDMAHVGYSFWFVVGAVIVSILNIVVIYFGTNKPREKKNVNPVMEEKGNGAIMLY